MLDAALPREGPRVRLRWLRDDDLARFQACRADPELGRYQGWAPVPDDEARAFLAVMATLPFCPPGEWMQLAIAERERDGFIGDIGLRLAPHGAALEIGFTLMREHQGRGLAFEAVQLALDAVFEHMAVQCVQAVVDARNSASLRLLQRLGFVQTGSEEAIFKGEVCQELHFERRR